MLKDLIISLSFAGIGLVLYLATSNIIHAVKGHGWERRINAAYATARIGFAVQVGLIAEAVWGAPFIPWTWRSTTFLIAGVGVVVGYAGITLEQRVSRRP